MNSSKPFMNRAQRASQVWAVLAFAALNRQIIPYALLAKLIGIPTAGVGHVLRPIQSYCIIHQLPPLTSIVVSDETGLPGSGFLDAENLAATQMAVFRYAWTSRQAPTPDEFEDATEKHGIVIES